MLTEPIFERGQLLFEQGRYQQALTEFINVLSVDPGHAEALLMKAYTLIQLDRHTEALEAADTLLQQWPGQPLALDLKARVLIGLKQPKQALTYIQEALSVAPLDAEYWATASLIYFDEKDYEDALKHAEEGLRLDPRQQVCLNIRNLCLAKLGRAHELPDSIEQTLAEDPGSAFSHTSAGWALLEKGDHKQARVHFAEALRLAPGMTWAEAGMLEALKAKNPVFRFFLKYHFWMANMKGQQQWAVVIVTFLGLRFLNSLDSSLILIKALQAIVMLFVWLTWFVDPLFNVLMLADKQGRHLLSDRKRSMYRYVAFLLPISFLAAVWGYLGNSAEDPWMGVLFIVGILGLGLTLPLSAWIESNAHKTRKRMKLVFYVMLVTAILSLITPMTGVDKELGVFNLFMIELVLFMFLRNFLLIEENN